MTKEPSINTYVDREGNELTAVPGSQMDLVLQENPVKWARVTERPAPRRSKAQAEETAEQSE